MLSPILSTLGMCNQITLLVLHNVNDLDTRILSKNALNFRHFLCLFSMKPRKMRKGVQNKLL